MNDTPGKAEVQDAAASGANPRSGKRRGVAVAVIVLLCVAAAIAYAFGKPASGPRTVVLTGETFSQATGSGVAMVDFWAEWCGPCRVQGPIMDALARRYEGKVTVGKVDVDAEESLSDSFGVESIPTIIVFKDGREAARFIGVTEEAELSEAVQRLL